MKFLKEFINESINKEEIDCFDYNEFKNLEKIDKRIHGTLRKANWENRKITVVLKNLNDSQINESDFKQFIAKLKALRKIDHSINRFLGLTRDSRDNYSLILEYANGGNLRDYLKVKFSTLEWDVKLQMALDVTRGLMCLHSKNIIHGNLHACNVLVNNGITIITDLKLLNQVAEVTSEYIVYVEPQYLRNPSYEQDMKSDIYSLGVLLWELSSGRPPFTEYMQKEFGLAQVENKLLNGEREKPIENTPTEYLHLYQKCWKDDSNLRPGINEVYEILSQLKLQLPSATSDRFVNKEISDRSSSHAAKVTLELFNCSTQQLIKQFKLNHGLVLNGHNIEPSLQGVIIEDGELKVNKVNLYKGQPVVYTYINSEDKKIDTCINFPVAEIVYNGNLLESFLEYTNDEKKLRELYGDFLARRFLVGGKLFIEDFSSATTPQADILKFYLFCVYNSAKFSTEIQFSNLFTLDLLPNLVTLDGKKLNTHEKLTNWMNNLYQRKMVNIISYDDLIPISRLKHKVDDLETFREKQPGVDNVKEKLSLEEWVGDAVNDNLMGWTRDFNLFRGLIINKNDKIKISKKIPINIVKIPEVNPCNKSYLKIIKPSTNFELALISSNIFPSENSSIFPLIKNNVELSTLPHVKNDINNYELFTFPLVKNDVNNYECYDHVIVKSEKYEILLNMNNVEPTEEFEQAIEESLNSMKPLKALQDVFNEYGHLFSQKIILGGSLRNILSNLTSSDDVVDVDDVDEMLESLNNLDISYLLTRKGRIIENNDLHDWIQNTNNHLEIVKFDDTIPLYNILKADQQSKINSVLKNNCSVIMTGINDLTDLNSNNIVNYKRVNFELSLESEDYEVFGLIISENNVKSDEVYVNFGLHDFNGFYAIIKKVEGANIDITEYFVLWIVIGDPSQLSVFSPNNREFQVDLIKKSIKLQPNAFNYDTIGTSFTLHKEYTVFAHANHSSISYDPNNIVKLVGWKEKSIEVQIESAYKIQSNESSSNSDFNYGDNDCLANEVDLRICILSTNYKSLKVDNAKERDCPKSNLNLIGHILNEENFNKSLFKVSNKNEVFVNIRNSDSTTSQPFSIQPEPNDKVILNNLNKTICKKCNYVCYAIYFQQYFENWTSGNDDIDKFIQDTQLLSHKDVKNVLEWIPYDRLGNITKDELGKMYRANWIDGNISYWDDKNQNWMRFGSKDVILKSLRNSKNITIEFANEIDMTFGITQLPETKYYMMVLNNTVCKKCNYTCYAMHFQQNFENWTSGNDVIDKFIQVTQLLSHKDVNDALEWIPYNRFYDIRYIAKGGFGKVYRANWIDGNLIDWNKSNQNWKRYNRDMFVALKSLDNSKNVTLEFMNEIMLHYKVKIKSNLIVRYYGITQDPKAKNYMIVLEYAEDGSLRNYLDKEYNKLNWNIKLEYLRDIILGLKCIHEKELIHRDLHIGNILKFKYKTAITDMGLCKPANYNALENAKNHIYGVLPYIAPEILRGQNYTKAADIYSFGIIMYELISGLPPYYDIKHDNNLAVKICKGLRPRFNIKVPQLIVHLIKRCLDANPLYRPYAKEMINILFRWNYESDDNQTIELRAQIKEADEINNNSSNNSITSNILGISYNTHSEAIYTSRSLDFNLPVPKNSNDYYEQNDNIISNEFSESLQIDIS